MRVIRLLTTPIRLGFQLVAYLKHQDPEERFHEMQLRLNGDNPEHFREMLRTIRHTLGVSAAIKAEVHFGDLLADRDDFDQASVHIEHALEEATTECGPNSEEAAYAQEALALLRSKQGRHGEQLMLAKAAYETREANGAAREDVLVGKSLYASALRRVGRLEEALPAQLEVVSGMTEEFGPDNEWTVRALGGLSYCYHDLREFGESQSVARQWVAALERVKGPEDTETQQAEEFLAHFDVHLAEE